MGALWLTLLVAFQAGGRHEVRQGAAPLSVCDLVGNDPTRLNGQVIKVRGVLGGTQEGIWLVEECKTQLVTKGVAWGNNLSVYVDASNEKIARSWERMRARVKQLHADSARDEIWVTITGRLETRPSMDDAVMETPHGRVKIGFGHMNGSPAEINVTSVGDVTVVRRRTDTAN